MRQTQNTSAGVSMKIVEITTRVVNARMRDGSFVRVGMDQDEL